MITYDSNIMGPIKNRIRIDLATAPGYICTDGLSLDTKSFYKAMNDLKPHNMKLTISGRYLSCKDNKDIADIFTINPTDIIADIEYIVWNETNTNIIPYLMLDVSKKYNYDIHQFVGAELYAQPRMIGTIDDEYKKIYVDQIICFDLSSNSNWRR